LTKLRLLAVDDERPALEDLVRMLEGLPQVGEVAGAASANDALVKLAEGAPVDGVFLDVRMPGLDGLELGRVLRRFERPPGLVFVTAFDSFAVDAFELAALDYLVKPFDDERFEQALVRGRAHVELREARKLRERLRVMLDVDTGPPSTNHIQRIPVESRGKVQYIPVEQIDYIAASGPYAEIVVGTRRHLVRETMQSLADSLDPARFMRVHRSAIVPLDHVETLLRGAGGDYELQLKGGHRVRVSRAKRDDVERRLRGR